MEVLRLGSKLERFGFRMLIVSFPGFRSHIKGSRSGLSNSGGLGGSLPASKAEAISEAGRRVVPRVLSAECDRE